MSENVRHVEVTLKSQKRQVFFEISAVEDPIRAAKRSARQMGFDTAMFDWSNARVLDGPAPESGAELEPFEEELLLEFLRGGIVTRRTG
jgi:hypothetical protein